MKRNLTRILSAALSLIMIMSVFMLPANAAKVDDCKGKHVDNTGDYMCDNCGIFVGKVTGFKIVSEKQDYIKFKWNPVEGADGYKLYIKDEYYDDMEDVAFDDVYTEVDTTDKTSITLDVYTASIDSYVVFAYKKMGRNDVLGEESQVVVGHSLPTQVTGLKRSNVLATKATLVWDELFFFDGTIKYRVYRYNEKTKSWDKIKTTSNAYYNITGLKKNTTYKYRVDAYYTDGGKVYAGSPSKTLTVKTSDTRINKKSVRVTTATSTKLFVDGTTQKVTWSTSDKKVATVSSNGTVKGVNPGKATITAKVGSKKYTCNVTVQKPIDYLEWYLKTEGTITGSNNIIGAEIGYDYGEIIFSNTSLGLDDISITTMEMDAGSKQARAQVAYLGGMMYISDDNYETTEFYGETKFTISKYTGKKYDSTYKISMREGISLTNAKKKGQTAVANSFKEWNKILKSATGLTMKDIGFTSYNG